MLDKESFMNRVENKVAVVTGGISGIGRATSVLLAQEGAKIAVVDLSDEGAQDLISEIESFGGTAKFWLLDTTQEQDVSRVFAEIVDEFGQIAADRSWYQAIKDKYNKLPADSKSRRVDFTHTNQQFELNPNSFAD